MKKLILDSTQARQGDVLVVRRADIPEDSEPLIAKSRVVLQEGEATGHAHAFYQPSQVTLFQTPKKVRHLRVVETALLKHEEHTEVPLAPGAYDLPRQTEWTDEDEPRPVQD